MGNVREISPDQFASAMLRDYLMEYAMKNGERIDEITLEAVKQLVSITKATAPRGARHSHSSGARPRFHTSITYRKLEATWFGASRYLWCVKSPNYRITHLIANDRRARSSRITHLMAKVRRARNSRIIPGNPFLQNAVDTVFRDYEAAIRRYFIE